MSAHTRSISLLLLAALALACGESPNAPVRDVVEPAAGLVGSGYAMSDLGTPLPCADGKANAINDDGDIIVGWTCGVATAWYGNGGPVVIGTLPGHTWSYGYAVNNSGQIVGSSGPDPFGGGGQAYIYTPGTGMVSIHDPALFMVSYATAINNAGVVVGWGRTLAFQHRAFKWTEADGMELLPRNHAYATDINDTGTIVGYVSSLIERSGVIWSGILSSLTGTMGGDKSIALGVNDADLVVGMSELDDFVTIHAFRYTLSAVARKFADLGPPASSHSEAYKISDRDRIVGFSGSPAKAITWYKGVRSYLPDLGAWSSARDVSRCGTIVGIAGTPVGSLQRPVRWDSQNGDCGRS